MIDLGFAEFLEIVGGTVSGEISVPETISNQTKFVSDSRNADSNSVFFALQGEHTHGHEFASQAVANGARLVIAEKPLELTVPVVVVSDSLKALTDLARFVVAKVRGLGKLKVVAVTGSNGKTTTKNMLQAILATKGPVVFPKGSFNNQVGVPLSLLKVSETTEFLVVEMGASGPGQISRLVDVVLPDVAIVLKVGMAHAGGFGGIEETAKVKAELVTSLPESATAILNADDPRVLAMRTVTRAKVVTFGLSEDATFRAENLVSSIEGTEFDFLSPRSSIHSRLKIIGEHMVMNALASVAACYELGVPEVESLRVLSELDLAERWRMQVLPGLNGSTIINDAYNASPDSMAAALKTLAELTRGKARAIAVLGEMAELGEFSGEEHDRIGRLVVRLNLDQLFVVGRGAFAIHSAAGLEGSWNGESVFFETADEAYDRLSNELDRGDVVLVKSSNSSGLRLLGDRLAGIGTC